MRTRLFSVIVIFAISLCIGYNIYNPVTEIQAAPVILSPIEFPFLTQQVEKSIDEIDVEVNLETSNVTVRGVDNAIVNVKTVGEPTPIIKHETKVIEVEKFVGSNYPKVNKLFDLIESREPSLQEAMDRYE